MKDIASLIKQANGCFSSCSDYSCVRIGVCTGEPHHALVEYHRKQAEKEKEDSEYRKFEKMMDRYTREKKGV